MENKSAYELYKNAMLQYYKKMTSQEYKGNSTFSPYIDKDMVSLSIKIPLKYPDMDSQKSHINAQGAIFYYDASKKTLLLSLGDLDSRVNDETGIEEVPERISLVYNSDGTMNVYYFSENNLSTEERNEEDISKRNYSAMLSYGEHIRGESVDMLINSDLLDKIDTGMFEELSRRLKYSAPEFDIDTLGKNIEDNDELEL